MALADIGRLRRNIKRLGQIILVFARYGFGPRIDRLNLQEHIPLLRRMVSARLEPSARGLSTEARLVLVFQELGTTFVKLGQILSTRPDIVGQSYAEEFKRLRDHVEPFEAAVARKIVETELKRPIDQVFSSFDDEPAGSGSIAQVHRATLLDGTKVMVKIRRPGIEAAILADMGLLRDIAALAEPQMPELRPTLIVDEFERTIRKELDFSVEATSTSRFHEMFLQTQGVRAPAVYWECSTAAVLTVQRLDGILIDDLAGLEARGHDRVALARRLSECFMAQYFREGTFHADPHPGNLLVADDGTINIIDFGMVGHLTADLQAVLTTVLVAAVKGEIEYVGETAAEVGIIGDNFDAREYRRDITDLYYKYQGMPLGKVDAKRLFGELMRIARDNDLSLPRDLVLLGKSVATVSSVARVLDPDCDVLRMAGPKADEFFRERLSPRKWGARAGLESLTLLRMIRHVPRELRSIVRKAESGQLQVGFRLRGLERTVSELDRASNRLSMSIYVAALLVASSLIIRQNVLMVGGVSVLGVLGYALAGLLSLWLAWGIIKSGRL